MASKVFTDQMNRKVEIPFPPQRIVSVVPSQTELLFDLKLNDRVTAITKFCIHPSEWFQTKTRIGGTKTLNLDRIREIQPDLIIANKEENTQSEIEILAKEFPVWISDIQDLDGAYNMIRSIGEICDCASAAEMIVQQAASQFDLLTPVSPSKRALYLIWNNPFMAVNQGTFIHHMMKLCGFENCTADSQTRYPEISTEQIKKLNPELILLSSEPFPFTVKHQTEIQAQFPNAQVILVDGESFSWYGSRLVHAARYFKDLIAEIA